MSRISMLCTASLFFGLFGCLGSGGKPAAFNWSALKDQENVKLEPNAKVLFTAPVHGSVGIGAECESSAPDILAYVSSRVIYDHPENMKKGMTGGDAGRKEFTFQALKTGTAKLVYRRNYRGTIEETKTISVIVE